MMSGGNGGGGVGAGSPSPQHLHVSTALLTGLADFSPEPLRVIAPELLVALIRSCAQQRTSAHSSLRGIYGRPVAPRRARTAAEAGAELAGAQSAPLPPGGVDGDSRRASHSAAPYGDGDVGGDGAAGVGSGVGGARTLPAWHDVAQDRRLALLMALMARCGVDPGQFAQ
jgi:hypothetical protein